MTKFEPFQVRWGENVGKPECPYMRRWVINLRLFSIRLHYWMASDDLRHFHDHPWWFVNIILRGSYIDVSPEGRDYLGPGSIRFRKANHKHTVFIQEGTCLSLLITGPQERDWGFWVPGRNRILRPLRYFSRYGHHQCEDIVERKFKES